MKILIVEDEPHKCHVISEIVKSEIDTDLNLTCINNVRDSVLAVRADNYDLVILDMSLPIYPETSEEYADRDFHDPAGAIEVILEYELASCIPKIIIVSQYSQYPLEGKFYPLDTLSENIQKYCGVEIQAAIWYSSDNNETRDSIKYALRNLA